MRSLAITYAAAKLAIDFHRLARAEQPRRITHGMNLGHSAEFTLAHELAHFTNGRIETPRVRNHELDPRFFSLADHAIAIVQGQRHGFFYHHMFAGFQGSN